jgi:ribonuclease P protein component
LVVRHTIPPQKKNVFLGRRFRLSFQRDNDVTMSATCYFRLSRHALTAVERNKLKRWVRSWFRTHQSEMPRHIIVHVRRPKASLSWSAYIRDVQDEFENFIKQQKSQRMRAPTSENVRTLSA